MSIHNMACLQPFAFRQNVTRVIVCFLTFGAMTAYANVRPGQVLRSVACDLLKNAFEDPIVSPGMRSEHLHSIFGAETFSDSVDDNTAFLPNVKSTCDDEDDKSMYWVPSLLGADGNPLRCSSRVYVVMDVPGADPFPVGLRIKADDPSHKLWFCIAPKGKGKRTKQIEFTGFPERENTVGIACTRWQTRMEFPSCWNGELDSPDHQSHMAYSIDRTCPDSHAIAIPELRVVVNYWLPDDVDENVVLSVPGDVKANTMHFDVIMGWDVDAIYSDLNGGERRDL